MSPAPRENRSIAQHASSALASQHGSSALASSCVGYVDASGQPQLWPDHHAFYGGTLLVRGSLPVCTEAHSTGVPRSFERETPTRPRPLNPPQGQLPPESNNTLSTIHPGPLPSHPFWRKGSVRALETHMDIVSEYGFTEENRGPQHVRAYISV